YSFLSLCIRCDQQCEGRHRRRTFHDHTYILRHGVNFTVPLNWNSEYNFVYAIGCSGKGSAGVAGTRAGAPGGGAPFVLKRNVVLSPNAILVSGADFSDCQGDQTPTWLKDSTGVIAIQADYGKDASGTTP